MTASTSEVYGDPQVHPQPESYWGHVNPIGPRGVYDEAKRFSEALTMAYHRQQGVDTAIVRIFNTYGPRMRPRDGRAIPTFLRQALQNQPITVFGDGSQTRSFCYVDDLVRGIILLAESGHHEPVNIGNPNEFTLLELAEAVIDATGSESQIVYRRAAHRRSRRCASPTSPGRASYWAGSRTVQLREGLERDNRERRPRRADRTPLLMPPTDRFVISFAAEPPQQSLPYGRWADVLREQFLAACADIDSDGEEIGDSRVRSAGSPTAPSAAVTYVPAVARTEIGYELFGYVSFTETGSAGPENFEARADFTGDVAEANPDWQLDLNEMVLGSWRGEAGNSAEMTLVWGVPLIPGGAVVTAELADHAVDQCELVEQRFTLIAPDNYRGDYLDIKLWGKRGEELAAESLYAEDDESDDEADASNGEYDRPDIGLSDDSAS